MNYDGLLKRLDARCVALDDIREIPQVEAIQNNGLLKGVYDILMELSLLQLYFN